jgi:transcriptional regulator with XRE-family HTH domain
MRYKPITKAELARQLGVSRTHITLLTQGKRKLSVRLADKLADVLAGKPNAQIVASNPLGGSKAVFGGFDSHALPPRLCLTFFTALLSGSKMLNALGTLNNTL